MQKKYWLYSKLFNLFQLDSYFRHAALGLLLLATVKGEHFIPFLYENVPP